MHKNRESKNAAPAAQLPLSQEDALPSPSRFASRRATLGALAALTLFGCGGGGGSSSSSSGDSGSSGSDSSSGGTDSGSATDGSTGSDGSGSSSGSCAQVAEETAGPFPADGSGASGSTANVLSMDGIVRSDIRRNIGSSTALAGIPLTLTITLQDVADGCAPLAGFALYIWHCDIDGEYSAYDSHVDESFLRGVQVTDESGKATFTTIFPGCYIPRVPHIHVEVFPSLAASTSSNNKIATSQFAFDESLCAAVYATSAYQNAGNAQRLAAGARTNANDMVFSDGTDTEMLTITGDATSGYEASITIAVSA